VSPGRAGTDADADADIGVKSARVPENRSSVTGRPDRMAGRRRRARSGESIANQNAGCTVVLTTEKPVPTR